MSEHTEASPQLRRLVLAARNVAYTDACAESLNELDQAAEAFAELAPWDDEPYALRCEVCNTGFGDGWCSACCAEADARSKERAVTADTREPVMSATEAGWQWWLSADAENYQGPFATREDAIAEGRDHAIGEFTDERGVTMLHFYITEARQDPVMLADWIDVDDMIQRAEESLGESDRVGAECDEGPWFDYPGETFADLEARIRRACTDWQTAHTLVFTCRTFSASRNEETVLIPADAGATDPSPPSSSGLSRGSTGPEGGAA